MNKRFVIGITKEDLYLHYIQNMCALLEMEAPIKELDDWLYDMVELGLYERDCLTHRNGDK
jgi:hypothetical protein